MKYRKKPVVIEAMQLDMNNRYQIIEWAYKDLPETFNAPIRKSEAKGCLIVNTLEGQMFASPGDWIIKGVKGGFYPVKPDIFEATYEKVEEK